ncbi:jacalin-like lectin [uncultured Shewanella sp.]|uniref:jacalin-like lectin n=1 Tax=uncultured Shewanella sp. TaxID=173975 RepID=UPI0026254A32|nr:jacalin-like lectin [uncultured Shewanella sp.]
MKKNIITSSLLGLSLLTISQPASAGIESLFPTCPFGNLCNSTPVVIDSVDDYKKLRKSMSSSSVGTQYGSYFNTKNDPANIPGNKIRSITIYEDGWNIDGIELEYSLGGSSLIGKKTSKKTTATLDDDEYITSGTFYATPDKLSNKSMKRLTRINLTTNKGKGIGKGRSDSRSKVTSWSTPDNRGVIGFYGYFKDSINKLGVVSDRLIDLELVSVDFDPNYISEVTYSEPTFVTEQTGIGRNNTNINQSLTLGFQYNETASYTDTYSETAGITKSMGYSISADVKFDAFIGVSNSYNEVISDAFSTTIGKSSGESTAKIQTVSTPIVVEAKTATAAEITIVSNKVTYPYTVTYRNSYDDKTFTVKAEITGEHVLRADVEWTNVGYYNDDNELIIYDEYQAVYGDYDESN